MKYVFSRSNFIAVAQKSTTSTLASVYGDFRYDRENDICVSFKNYEFFEVVPEYIIL